MEEKPRKSQFSGLLIGQCLGDALGFPMEGYVSDVCRHYVDGILRTGRAGDVARRPFPFGQYTDDSQLARELLRSYLARGRFVPSHYASLIAALFSENRIVGRGRATEEAALRLAAGVPWDEAGTPSPSAGNGSAMRAGPVGLIFYDNPGELVLAAVDQGRVTHRDSRCCAGAVAIAGAVALALKGDHLDRDSFVAQLAQWAEPVDASVATALSNLRSWSTLPPEEAVVHIASVGQIPERRRVWQGITPFVTGSVLWSLYAFLRSPADYWETICTAIVAGGDVDTTAAMAGAVSGAHLGLEALPALLARRLTDRGSWAYGELVELAEKVYDMKMSQQRKDADPPESQSST